MRYLPTILLIIAALLVLLPIVSLAHGSDCAFQTGLNATVIFPEDVSVDVEGQPIMEGQQLTVHGEDGRCAGRITWKSGAHALTVWGAEPLAETLRGLQNGEEMSFRLYDPANPTHEHELSVTLATDSELYQPSKKYVHNGIYMVESVRAEAARVEEKTLSPPAPNPFVDQTQLTLTLERPQRVNVDVYNVLGTRVAELHNGWLDRGANTLRFNADGHASGMYFIVAEGEHFRQTRKVSLVR